MCSTILNLIATFTFLLLLITINTSALGINKRGRRLIDCSRYVFAPRCRGVSAKRASTQDEDIIFPTKIRISKNEDARLWLDKLLLQDHQTPRHYPQEQQVDDKKILSEELELVPDEEIHQDVLIPQLRYVIAKLRQGEPKYNIGDMTYFEDDPLKSKN